MYNLIIIWALPLHGSISTKARRRNKQDPTRLTYQAWELDQIDRDSYGLDQNELNNSHSNASLLPLRRKLICYPSE